MADRMPPHRPARAVRWRRPALAHTGAARMRGAALLLAMLIVALLASVAAAASWRQWRSAQAEADERAQMQSHWLVRGALDWSKIILNIDAVVDSATVGQGGQPSDHFNEPWAVPLAEAKLGTFLSAEHNIATDANADLGEAFFSGAIVDLNGRLNFANLLDGGQIDPQVLQQFERLFIELGLGAGRAAPLAQRYLEATRVDLQAEVDLAPTCVEQLAWLGLSEPEIALLRPHITLLPAVRTRLNLNTASERVLAAALPEGAGSAAARLAAVRSLQHFDSLAMAQALLPGEMALPERYFSVGSDYFLVSGRLRLDALQTQDHYILRRDGRTLHTVGRECAVPPPVLDAPLAPLSTAPLPSQPGQPAAQRR